nr:hypothetical protein [uncultured Roseateles sp.]
MTEFNAEQCLAALRGAEASPDASARAGVLMRQLMLEQLEPTPADAAAEQALMARLRAAGAFATPRPRLALPHWLTTPDWRWLAVPGLALLALVAVRQFPEPVALPAEGDVMRGAEAAQRITAEHPEQLAAELQTLLLAHGVTARLSSQAQGLVQLQARVATPDPGLILALAQHGVQVPAHGRLFLLIVPATPGKPQAGGH